MFNLDEFVCKYVIKRNKSIFDEDINENYDKVVETLNGKTVLVIGGAGSIGASFIREIIQFDLRELVVVDTSENALTELTRSLRSNAKLALFVPNEYHTYPLDYSSVTFQRMFISHKGFDIVANFSAHKHVRSEKDIYSIEALLRNNVINTKFLLELLELYPPEVFFCVSTDKATNPVNIMGASKRIMEDLIFSYSDSFAVKTARFANVAFSNGSLPVGFIERINQHQPISAPNDVKRYFVSIKESGQICMLSSTLGNNREVFFPKLMESQMISFDTIAEDLLASIGYKVDYCKSEDEALTKALSWVEGKPYPVYFSGSNTSGEKLFEEFYSSEEKTDLDRFKSLGVIVNKGMTDKKGIDELILTFNKAFESEHCKKSDIIRIISTYLPEFDHIETGKSLDNKM